MLIEEAKIGDRIKVPYSTGNYFSFDRGGTDMEEGRFIIATVLSAPSFGEMIIGWETDKHPTAGTYFPIDKETKPEYHKRFPKLKHGCRICTSVRVEPAKAQKDPAALGWLLPLAAMGAAISQYASCSSSKTKNENIEANQKGVQ